MANLQRTYTGDPTNPYVLCDTDDSGAIKYYGYQRPDGSWYIQKEEVAGGINTFRYASGTDDYSTNFTNRAGLTYDYPAEVLD